MTIITGTLSDEKSVIAAKRVQTFMRAAIWALPVWAAMLFLGALTHQPNPQTVVLFVATIIVAWIVNRKEYKHVTSQE